MILVDVFVPSVNKTYDFQLSETTPVAVVIDEISEMIEQKERSKIVGDIGKLQLICVAGQRILEKNRTLSECNITTGQSLIFV